MSTKAGEVREMLIAAMSDLRAGKMKSSDAMAIAKLASQVNESLKVELMAIAQLRKMQQESPKLPAAVGKLPLGDEAA